MFYENRRICCLMLMTIKRRQQLSPEVGIGLRRLYYSNSSSQPTKVHCTTRFPVIYLKELVIQWIKIVYKGYFRSIILNIFNTLVITSWSNVSTFFKYVVPSNPPTAYNWPLTTASPTYLKTSFTKWIWFKSPYPKIEFWFPCALYRI